MSPYPFLGYATALYEDKPTIGGCIRSNGSKPSEAWMHGLGIIGRWPDNWLNDEDWVSLKAYMDTMGETYLRESMEHLVQSSSP